MGSGWTKVPKNQTDVKLKIVERSLAMRRFSDSSQKYELDQKKIMDMLQNVWDMRNKIRLCIAMIDCACSVS